MEATPREDEATKGGERDAITYHTTAAAPRTSVRGAAAAPQAHSQPLISPPFF